MSRSVWSKTALRDLENIRSNLMSVDPDIYKTLVIQAEAASQFLLEFPRAGSPFGNSGYRKWRIGKLPYLLIYNANPKRVMVLRVYHERQDWGIEP
jgi:toxin ParE1/3/4